MNRDTLLELATRCEQERGKWYNHDLDADIYEALGYSVIRGTGRRVCWRYRGHGPFGFHSHWVSMQAFTYKLDAAIRLVPEGWRVGSLGETVIEGDDPWNARLLEKRFDGRAKSAQGDAATPALALCAASLRAKASQ